MICFAYDWGNQCLTVHVLSYENIGTSPGTSIPDLETTLTTFHNLSRKLGSTECNHSRRSHDFSTTKSILLYHCGIFNWSEDTTTNIASEVGRHPGKGNFAKLEQQAFRANHYITRKRLYLLGQPYSWLYCLRGRRQYATRTFWYRQFSTSTASGISLNILQGEWMPAAIGTARVGGRSMVLPTRERRYPWLQGICCLLKKVSWSVPCPKTRRDHFTWYLNTEQSTTNNTVQGSCSAPK